MHSGCVSVSAQRVGVGVHSGCVSVGVHRGWVGARSVFVLLVSYGAYIDVWYKASQKFHIRDLSTSLYYLNYYHMHLHYNSAIHLYRSAHIYMQILSFPSIYFSRRMFNDHDFQIFYNYGIEKFTIAVLYNNMDGQQ